LGGRAAEELVFNEIYSGSLDDLEKATKNAYMMVVYYGFNEKMGNVSYYDSSTQQELSWQKPFSEDTSKLIDNEIRILIAKEYDHAKRILNEHKDLHEKLMLMLLEKEVVYKEQLENLLGKKIAA
jgi:cell division protease FtsH